MLKCLCCVGKVWAVSPAHHPSPLWSCSVHSGTPLLQVTTEEGKYCKNQYFADGQHRKGLCGLFGSRFGNQTEICRGLRLGCRRAFVPENCANVGGGSEGCWRKGTSLAEFSQPFAANRPPLSAVLPARPSGCAAAGCPSWDLVMVFLYSSALMSLFVEGWIIEDYVF